MSTSDQFREVMRNLVSGVTVVTTQIDGRPFGMTATSVTSVSVEPALVLVCLDKTSRTHDALRQSGIFAVNILSGRQENLAVDFATSGIERFKQHPSIDAASGLPLIEGAIGHLQCRVTGSVDGGDHTIFLGEVRQADASEGAPLVHFQGSFLTLPQTIEKGPR